MKYSPGTSCSFNTTSVPPALIPALRLISLVLYNTRSPGEPGSLSTNHWNDLYNVGTLHMEHPALDKTRELPCPCRDSKEVIKLNFYTAQDLKNGKDYQYHKLFPMQLHVRRTGDIGQEVPSPRIVRIAAKENCIKALSGPKEAM